MRAEQFVYCVYIGPYIGYGLIDNVFYGFTNTYNVVMGTLGLLNIL